MKRTKILLITFSFIISLILIFSFKGISRAKDFNELVNSFLRSNLPAGEKKRGLQDAISVFSTFLPSEVAQPLQNVGGVLNIISDLESIKNPEDFIRVIYGVSPKAGEALYKVYSGVAQITKKPSTSATSPSQPSPVHNQPSPAISSGSSTDIVMQVPPSPAQLIKPEGTFSLPSQPSQPTQPSLQKFRELEAESVKPGGASATASAGAAASAEVQLSIPSQASGISSRLEKELRESGVIGTPTTRESEREADKISVYYCDRTTAQCLYLVVLRVEADNPNYYRSLSQCQANCKKASYICYRYEYRYSGSGCNYGFQCVPYASDIPCKNECSPSGTPLIGTAQQQQQQTTQQQTTQQQYYCQGVCFQGKCTSGYFSQPCSNMKTCKNNSDCGGVTQPSTNVTYWCTACRGNKCITGATLYPCSNYKSCRTDADCQSSASDSGSSSQSQQSHQTQASSSGSSCIRQEGKCSSSNNCLSCPSGYYRKSGACSGCPSKGYDCYVECCPSR